MTQSAVSPAAEPRVWCRDHRGRTYAFEDFLKLTESFHGYPAPGVVIGAKMVHLAMRQMPVGTLFDAVSETAKCLPDAVQLLTPCTIGNGWLRIVPLDRYAVTLFDKVHLSGIRISVDPERLDAYPETRHWFFGVKPKRKDRTRELLGEIEGAGENLFAVQSVRVRPEHAAKRPSGPRAVCPDCGEAYPSGHGPSCLSCQGQSRYYERG
ncbi:MAG: formylmethanofuran dehydrogenase subunit E family protein [Desulfobacterales bacterium]|jgi:formylmethanofuran dehydrogenase subunit E|nr:formylmethanofuran dehydrogenase subunit E family protein [Desulfobacterales bacterium]